MEQYCMFTVTLILCVMVCHGQLSSGSTVEQLHTRVRQLEDTVINLVAKLEEKKTSHSASNTNSNPGMAQDAQKRGFMYPTLSINPVDGLTLGRFANGDEVGFSLSLTQDMDLEYQKKIMFDKILENIGSAYDKSTGEFVCPISGTYLFALNIACKQGSYIETSVEIKDQSARYILNAVCDHRKRTPMDGYSLYCGETQNGGTTIAQLKQGERVSVKKVWPLKGLGTVVGMGHTTFSGYLLRPT